MQTIDIHPHIISDDEKRYPPAPLFGKRSDWSQERPCTVDTLIAAEVYFNYTPLFNLPIMPAQQLYHTAYFRPRLGSLTTLN